MKKFFTMLLLFIALSLPSYAQEVTKKVTNRGSDVNEITQEDYCIARW